jgi:hypothetical protein
MIETHVLPLRRNSAGCIAKASGVGRERIAADVRVTTANCIARESVNPDSCVMIACGVTRKRGRSICGVAEAAGVAHKRSSTSSGIVVCGVDKERTKSAISFSSTRAT